MNYSKLTKRVNTTVHPTIREKAMCLLTEYRDMTLIDDVLRLNRIYFSNIDTLLNGITYY